MPSKEHIYPIERIIAVATYLSAGFLGFVWWIIAALLKKSITGFLMYHIMQSIFISILYFLLITFFNLMYTIPIINAIPYYINMSIPLLFNHSILQVFSSAVIAYLVITSFFGIYSYIPWVSDIINYNTNRR